MEENNKFDKLNEHDLRKLMIFKNVLEKKPRYIIDCVFRMIMEDEDSLWLKQEIELLYVQKNNNSRKYIDKNCYFIDLENINGTVYQYLQDKMNSILYFVTNDKLSVDESKIDKSNRIYIASHNSMNKNCADFLLDLKLFEVVEKYQFRTIEILSGDRGFQSIIDILRINYSQSCCQKSI